MNRPINRIVIAAGILLAGALTGCGGAVKMHPATAQQVAPPAADKVQVVFMRTSMIAGAISADLFEVIDGSPRLIGTLDPGKKVVYVTTPGRKLFMAYGDAADFMLGDLAAGGRYFAIVRPNWGSGGMIPTPIRTDGSTDFNTGSPDFGKWVGSTTVVEPDAKELDAWNSTEQDHIQTVYEKYWARFRQKTPEQIAERTLRPQDGFAAR
jgi:hypothetical protein